MSYNFTRKVDRAQMRGMINAFKKEANLSGKEFMTLISGGENKGRVKGLKDQFARMLAIAMNKLKEVESARESADGVSKEDN